MYLGHSPTWKCGSVGSIAHILWFCKSRSSFWRQIFVFISSISRIPSISSPTLGLGHPCGHWKIPPPESRITIIHLLLAAKVNITMLWKTSDIPTISGVVVDLNYQCEMEKMLARKNMRLEKFVCKWSKWLLHQKCIVQTWTNCHLLFD